MVRAGIDFHTGFKAIPFRDGFSICHRLGGGKEMS
nr:MAG TPA: hypothetical protein [Caudoviricetes sp.]